jgi:hypothetical protein
MQGLSHMQDHHLQKVIYRMAKIHCDEEMEEEKTRIFSTWNRGGCKRRQEDTPTLERLQ